MLRKSQLNRGVFRCNISRTRLQQGQKGGVAISSRTLLHASPRPLGDSPPFVKRRRSLPDGVAPVHSIHPCRKAVEPMRKPRPRHRPQAVRYARETPAQAAATLTRSGSKQAPSRSIAQAALSSRSDTERRARA